MGPLRARGATAPFGGAQNILTNSTDTNTFYAGPLPAAGQWARLSVPAGAVGLQARLVQGISFAVDGGAAAWDRAGKLVLEPVTNGVATSQGQGGAGPLYPNPVCVNPPANLVGWWRGEGNCNDWKNLDNGTGQGTGLTFPPGEVGYCFSLDGNTADIFVGATTTLDVGNNGSPGFTIEGWINPLDLNSRPIVEWNNPNAPTPYGVHFWISVGAPAGTGTGCLFANLVGIDGANHWVPTAAGLLTAGPGVWHHVALTYNESTYTGCIYLDGVLQASVPFAAFTPETAWDLYFGARVAPSFEVTRWYGGLDEISLYNRALGAAEISSIYNASSAGKCPAGPSCYTAPTPVSWWPAEGTCADSVGANTGYAEGASFSYAPGEVNQAFSLYAGAFVWVHASSSLDVGQGSFTLEAWIYPADTVNRPIFEWNSGQGSIPYGVHLWTSEPAPWGNGPGCLFANLVDCYGDDQWVITQGNLFVPGAWLHVALVYDAIGGYGYIYVDGQQQACARVLNCPQTTPPLFMGARLAPQSEVTFWSGKIDEATLYNEALAQGQIQDIYNAGIQGKCHVATPPSITTQPQGQTVCAGANVTFSVVASGTAPLSYQWTFNGVNIPFATSSSYTINDAQTASAGGYAVLVSNSAGSVTSQTANLTVNVPPSITAQPVSQTVPQGGNVTFSVAASGTAPLTYQWTFNGTIIPGATAANYTINGVSPHIS